jgi:AraC family transcriptional regulator of adaptative response / DNA-3-methyladenine glycosylase II
MNRPRTTVERTVVGPDPERSYRAVSGRDPRYDGRIYVGVVTTGVYCRPSCPSRTPLPTNCRFYSSAAAAVAAGFRACRRCRPDALPGSKDWDVRGDLVARALRLIRDGAVDDLSVTGLADVLHVSARHLQRVLVAEVGATPLQLAQTRRAQLARMLIDQTTLSMSDVAFAAGFQSVRQFNDVMRDEYGATPSSLRRGSAADDDRKPEEGAHLSLRLRCTPPYDSASWLEHVTARAVPGHERVGPDGTVSGVCRAARSAAEVTVRFPADAAHVQAELSLGSLEDLSEVVARLRHWLDLDADPAQIGAALGSDPRLREFVAARPGLRVAGALDPVALAFRAVLGQQISVAGARTLTARLVEMLGESGPAELRHFPSAGAIAAAGPERLQTIGLTHARAATLMALAQAVDAGLELAPGGDRNRAREQLAGLPGIGPWTVEYIALRALGDPDAFPGSDLVLRNQLGGVTARAANELAAAWRPWRAYAAQHLWTAASRQHAQPRQANDARSAPSVPMTKESVR